MIDRMPGTRIVRYDVAGTTIFVLAMAVAIPLRNERSGQVLIAAVSMALFAAGAATSLWAYAAALDRSRTEEVGVANLFLLSGQTAEQRVRRTMWACFGTQIVVALAGAIVGVVGLDKGRLNALAFGILVPMFGIGANGLWAARHGRYGQRSAARTARTERPNNRKIG
jgi:hypothetical protein